MNRTSLDYILKALADLIPLAQAGANVAGALMNIQERTQAMAAANRGPTDEEWKALDDQADQLRQELHDGQT